MARIPPLDPTDVPELAGLFDGYRATLGFVPNSFLTMARRPKLVAALAALGQAVYEPSDEVPLELKFMVANVASRAAGCRYCTAHTAATAAHFGPEAGAKLGELWEFATSPRFDERERAALEFARAAASVPNEVTDAHVAALHRFFDDTAVVELLAVVAMFGFLNRWNDSLATELEPEPTEAALAHLAAEGWSPGKHAG